MFATLGVGLRLDFDDSPTAINQTPYASKRDHFLHRKKGIEKTYVSSTDIKILQGLVVKQNSSQISRTKLYYLPLR